MDALLLTLCLALLAASTAWCGEPTPDESAAGARLAGALFLGREDALPTEPGLYVLQNHGPVLVNERDGRPLKLVGVERPHGLFTHANSEIVVRLPGPAKRFRAHAGIDDCLDSRGGRGTVVFAVRAGEREVYRSGVTRVEGPLAEVDVELSGAETLTLVAEDAGDGISWDQAVWADPVVTLEDGRAVRLDELPVHSGWAPFEAALPFDFEFGGKRFRDLAPSWSPSARTDRPDDARARHTLAWKDPVTGLAVKCVAAEYRDFPHVEWTVYLRNEGTADTPPISDLRALDFTLGNGGGQTFGLRHFNGSPSTREDYAPRVTPLPRGASTRLGTDDGRPSMRSLPYFNLDAGDQGLIVAVGWPGQWYATLKTDEANRCRIVAGQEDTQFVLHPGEEFRTPLIVVQPWRGSWLHAQNVWRRWMVAHNLPKVKGAIPQPQLLATSSGVYFEMVNADEASQKMFVDRYVEERVGIDYWWMDAGWYPNAKDWKYTGTWEVDRKRFPNGLRAISDHARAQGIKTLVWFEPERVAPTTWLMENRPQWILRSPTFDASWGSLLNLGDPEVYDWLIERIDGLIVSEGIDIYRQDFNIPPLTFWRAADAADRKGITEQRYVVNFLRFWDELRRRHPDMLIDDCASGGRRLDLETLRRSVPLWRSDYAMEPVGQQCQTHNLNMWVPYSGTGTAFSAGAGWSNAGAHPIDPYAFWSNTGPSLVLSLDVRAREMDYEAVRRLVKQWRGINDCYTGDYYPLTSWSDAEDIWVAWQFDRPDLGKGFVQALRRPKSPYTSATLRVQGLKPDADYELWNVEAPQSKKRRRGSDLLEKGLEVSVSEAPGVVVMAYRKVGKG